MAERIRRLDWAATPLGPKERWPQSLRTLVDMMLASPQPTVIAWGPRLTCLYNDAYRPLLGSMAEALGRPFLEVWPEAGHIIAPQIDKALAGEASLFRNAPFTLRRHGHPEQAYFDFSFSPLRDERGEIAGLLNIGAETTAQVQMTEGLRESENRLSAVLEQLPVGVAIAAIPTGRLVYHNTKAVELLGHPMRTAADYTGYARYGALHPDGTPYRPDEYPIGRAVLHGETVDREPMIYRRGDGRITELEVSGARIHDSAGRPVFAVSTFDDITEKRVAERALRESEERFRAIAEQAEVGIAMADCDNVVTYANDRFCQMSQRRRDEIVGRTIANATHPDDWPENAALLRRTLETGAPFTIEKRRLRPDGSSVWARNTVSARRDAAGAIVGSVVVSIDVTDRREASQRLRENERRLRTLIEGIPQMVWRAGSGGERTWSSPQWTAFTGLTEEASRGYGWLAAVHPDDRQRAMGAWRRAQATDGFTLEYRIGPVTGRSWRWFRVEAKPMRDEGGDPVVEWLGTATDVDDLRRMQDQQEVMVAELQHRTRNLIAIIQSIAHQTVALSDDLETFGAEFSDRLAALSRVQGLLSARDQEPATIATVVRMELDALGAESAGGRVSTSGPAVPLRPRAVQTLALAVHELATNARKHGALSVPGGRLTVSWSIRPDGEQESRLVLEWIESGLSLAAMQRDGGRRGYGRRLIERALPYSLGARTTFELTPSGLHCVIDLPLTRRGDTEIAG